MEMRSDKTEELRRRWGLEKKAQREPCERLASIGCKFKSCGSELSSLPSASRKIIKDAIRSVFKDESGGLLSWLSLSHSIAPSNYSPLHLSSFESLWLVIANDGMPGRETAERRATCGIFPCFPAAAAVLSETCNVCVGVSVCHAAG